MLLLRDLWTEVSHREIQASFDWADYWRKKFYQVIFTDTALPTCTPLFCSSCGIRKEQQGAHTPAFTTNSILIPQSICQTILSMKCPRWFPGQETAIHFLFFKPLSSTYRKRKFSKNSMNSCSLLLLSLELGVQAAASCC